MIGKSLAMLIAAAAIASPACAQRVGSSPVAPASAGTTVQTLVECGSGYESHELYDVKITLLETVRGERAWGMIKAADAAAQGPKQGWEYVLARIRFEYAARGRPGDCSHKLKGQEFAASAADGQAYPATSVTPPRPGLEGTVSSGDSLEGWIAFSVPRGEASTLMSFSTKEGGGLVHGGNAWFLLY
jgi:hypothetical protein